MTVAHGPGPVRLRSPRAVRPTPEQLDAAILDTAAEMFARHGYAGTSVQQVADTVGYSKTGLLRRFPSKQALYDGVLAHVVDCVLGVLQDPAPGLEGDLLRDLTATAFANPGSVLLVLEALRPGSDLPGAERLDELAHALLGRLTDGLADPRDRLRAVLALQLVANAALLTIEAPPPGLDLPAAHVQDVALRAAHDVLGDPR